MQKKRMIVIFGIILLALIVVSAVYPLSFLEIQKSPQSLPSGITVYAYGANGLVSKQKGSEVSYYHNDNLGSSSLVTDSSGNKVYNTDYYPFGASIHENGKEKYKYNGKELDNSGLYYYGARYYDASIGRFISVDPVSGNIYNSQRLNRYSYTLNNPLKYVDPTGGDEEFLYGFTNLDELKFLQALREHSDFAGMQSPLHFFDTAEDAISFMVDIDSMNLENALDAYVDEDLDETVKNMLTETVNDKPIFLRVPKSSLSEVPSSGGVLLNLGDNKFAYASFDALEGASGETTATILNRIMKQKGKNPYVDVERALLGRHANAFKSATFLKLGKILPGIGICVGLMCTAQEARAGNWGSAGAELAGTFLDPVDYAMTWSNLYTQGFNYHLNTFGEGSAINYANTIAQSSCAGCP